MIDSKSYETNGMKWFDQEQLQNEEDIFDNVKELALHGLVNFFDD